MKVATGMCKGIHSTPLRSLIQPGRGCQFLGSLGRLLLWGRVLSSSNESSLDECSSENSSSAEDSSLCLQSKRYVKEGQGCQRSWE